MKRLIDTKFWDFSQNNSGGYFVNDNENGICEYVIIEAQTYAEAWDKLTKIGDKVDGFWDFCPCCGERWYDASDEDDGNNEPCIYGEPLHKLKRGLFRKKAFIHYYDGTIKEFIFK